MAVKIVFAIIGVFVAGLFIGIAIGEALFK